ncbi:hypothetical protein SHI21_08910 [Bacteriovorax sp. PP10]|uniref:Lipoprotein n=1 Tax=Bacteriovorax antarcticus TaxID=3088717 RepID=A0ABU5VTE0_9BACT|nr:hypothetical protein [Bacteriovorax sp. PP10]MEA9356320.1 hypothetical protein [Bacteriovorax sp. PP10]
MIRISTLSILAGLVLSSCSSTKVIAPSITANTQSLSSPADVLFTFKKSNMSPADDDLFDKAQEHVRLLVEQAKIKVKWIEDEKLDTDIAFKVEPTLEKETPTIVIKYADDIFQDHSATLNLTRFLDALFDPKAEAPTSFFEMYNNAVANDPTTLVTVAKMRRDVLTPLDKPTCYVMNTSQYNGFVAGESSLWKKKVDEYVKLEKKIKSEKRKPAQVAK